ncbi:unnamed protein product [Mytilus coruscus]|uniref:Uncharacterized protein n=1 Tax=Mytilus coruscus TaxID=42192 RepID=A0A6J8C0A7_MYTCO|nr:unnamed protein product [Mytilus coruscus]
MCAKDLLLQILFCFVENFTQTTANLSEIFEESEITNPTLTEKSSNENFTQTTTNLSEESEITNPTSTKKSSDGILDREIVLYAVVAACIIVTLGLSYSVQKYRKKTKKETRAITMQRTHSNKRNSLVESNLSIYNEIDETMLVENAHINVLQNEISINTNNTSYLYPIHIEDDKISSSVSAKSVNNSYLSIFESDQNRNSDESDRNDDTRSYLHPYHTINEDWKEKTHQYGIKLVSNKDTDDSFDSSTQMINDGYLNPYQPLKEDWKQKSHSYEVPVKVHHCQLSSTVPSVLDEDLKEEGNDNNQITRIKHNKVAHIDGAVISTCNKQEMADGISTKDERKEISASIENNLEISKELTNMNNFSTNSFSSTERENALVPVVERDIKVFDKNEDNPHDYNLLKNIMIHTVASIHTDQNTNVHNFTDAKSQ